MAGLTTVEIARAWSRAINTDSSITHWAQEKFNKNFQVSIGADMRRAPSEADAPFIVVFPDAWQSGSQSMHKGHELGLVAGIADPEFIELFGVLEMRGLERLSELSSLLEKTMAFALSKALMQEFSVEYDILQFPLLMALMTVKVEENLPIGGRR